MWEAAAQDRCFRTLQDPAAEGCRSRMGHNTFGIWNENAYQLWMDVSTLSMLMDELPEDSLRASQSPTAWSGIRASSILNNRLKRGTSKLPPSPCLAAASAGMPQWFHGTIDGGSGNSHLDLAWLWPMQETHRKTARYICRPAASFLEQYPEYRYIQKPAGRLRDVPGSITPSCMNASAAPSGPAAGSRRERHVVEPDTNIPSGEALVRQLVFWQALLPR